MPDIHIQRDHTLGLPAARKIAFKWAEQAEEEFGMDCTYEEAEKGGDCDTVTFTRSGVKGTLNVTADRFELDAQLGFLLQSGRHPPSSTGQPLHGTPPRERAAAGNAGCRV